MNAIFVRVNATFLRGNTRSYESGAQHTYDVNEVIILIKETKEAN